MADAKITALTELTSVTNSDLLAVVDDPGGSPITKKATVGNVMSAPGLVLTSPQINDTSSDHQYVFTVSELTADRNVTLPLLTGNDEFVFKDHTQTLTNKTLTSPVFTLPQINDTTADHQYITAVSELEADRTVTLPLLTGNDEFVFKDHAQTLTNKTIDGDLNTLLDIANTSVKTSVLGYAQITSGFSTTTYGSSVDVTGLAVTFTAPGSRKVKVTIYARQCAGNGISYVSLFESSTQLHTSNQIANTVTLPIIYVGEPSAGEHTYKVVMGQQSAGTMWMRVAPEAPGFILVELI